MKILSIDVDWVVPTSRYHLKELNNLFFSKVETTPRIAFARYHHQILQIGEVLQSNNIILHNIDDHHDFVYEKWQEETIKQGLATHGAWVGNLLYEGKIAEYYWYYNTTSHILPPESFLANCMISRQPPVRYSIEEDLQEAWKIDYDLIFISKSAETLHSSLYCLYDTYMDYCLHKYQEKTQVIKIFPDLPNTPIPLR